MKLSCLPVSLYPALASGELTLGGWFELARALGLDGADLSVAHLPDRSAAALAGVRRAAEQASLPIVMLATYSDFTHPDARERARQADETRAWIEAANRLGAQSLRLTAGQAHEGVGRAEGLAWAAEGLTCCLDDARAAGVQLLYENHVRGAVWSQNDFTQPAERFLEVVERTAGTDLKVLFDTANCLALGDDPLAVLAVVLGRVGALHVSDIRRVGAFEPTVIGSGAAPIVPVLQRLAASGFGGWISIEEASRTGEAGFRQAVAFVRHALEATF
jgi:sugar phosphate isomerase/epimerase